MAGELLGAPWLSSLEPDKPSGLSSAAVTLQMADPHPPCKRLRIEVRAVETPQPSICRQPSSFPSAELTLSNQPDRASSPPSNPSAVWGCFGRANPHQVLTRWPRPSRLLEISCSWRSAISRPSVAEGRIPAAFPPLGQRPMLAFVRWEATGFQLNF